MNAIAATGGRKDHTDIYNKSAAVCGMVKVCKHSAANEAGYHFIQGLSKRGA